MYPGAHCCTKSTASVQCFLQPEESYSEPGLCNSRMHTWRLLTRACRSSMRLLMRDSRSFLAARTASCCGAVSPMVSCNRVNWGFWTLKYVLERL